MRAVANQRPVEMDQCNCIAETAALLAATAAGKELLVLIRD